MKGSVKDCLADLFGRLPADAYVDLLAEFVGVQPLAVRRWQETWKLPKGASALRLRVFLEALGYQLNESLAVPLPSHRVGQLIGYGGASVETIQTQLDYSEPHALYRLLLHGTAPAKTQAYRLELIARDSDDELEAARKSWEDRLAPLREQLGHTKIPVASSQASEDISPARPTATTPPVPEPGTESPIHRRRERPKRTKEHPSSEAVNKALSHTMFAFDYLLGDVDDKAAVAKLISGRFSTARLQAMRSFIDQALKGK